MVPRLIILLVVLAVAAGALWMVLKPASPDELRGAVVILLDTLRPDHLSCYGYDRDTSPCLARLAKEGVLFENVVSAAPWTLPSMANFFSAHRLDESVFDERLKRSLVDAFRRAGFATAAFTEGGFVSSFFGFNRGFSTFTEEEGAVQLQGPGRRNDPEAAGGIERTFDRARLWLYKYRETKFFVFIHTHEAHAPYTRRTFVEGMSPGAVGEIFTLDKPPKLQSGELSFNDDELRYLRSLYDGGILECDRQIASFLAYLEEIDLLDTTLVVVTSDHGEELGEQYRNYSGAHGHSLHDNQVLVPLILHNPREDYPVKRIPCQVRLMDTLPTVAEILGVDLGQGTDGSSLLPFLEGTERKGRIAFGGGVKTDPDRLFIRWLDYKYVRVTGFGLDKPPMLPDPPKIRLHDLEADPLERINLAEERPEVIRQMEALEAKLNTANGTQQDFTIPEDMDEALRKRLESLGYLR